MYLGHSRCRDCRCSDKCRQEGGFGFVDILFCQDLLNNIMNFSMCICDFVSVWLYLLFKKKNSSVCFIFLDQCACTYIMLNILNYFLRAYISFIFSHVGEEFLSWYVSLANFVWVAHSFPIAVPCLNGYWV